MKPKALRAFRHFAVPFLVLLAALAALSPARAEVTAIVIDAGTGRTIVARDADHLQHPASLAKMMTLYLAFEAVSKGRMGLDDRLPVSREAASREPTKLGLRPGQRVPLKDLMLGLVTQSANDAAVVIAEGLAGSEREFAARMTQRAHELGMTRTEFRNASGLPDPDAWTTARDMSRLALALLRDYHPYYRYFSTERFEFRGRTYTNHNHLLGRYEGLDGIKTGYTRASGFHLAASAKRGERRVIAVVMGGTSWASRDREMVGLLDDAFATPVEAPRAPVLHAITDRVERVAVSLSPIASAEAAAPASTQDMPAETTDDAASSWSVQVGAFQDQGNAERRAEDVMALDSRLTASNKRVVATERYGRTLYLVRFNELGKADAAAICGALRSAGRGCIASPGL